MSDHNELWQGDPDPYWEPAAVNDRDEFDLHVRRVEEDERDRLTEHGA